MFPGSFPYIHNTTHCGHFIQEHTRVILIASGDWNIHPISTSTQVGLNYPVRNSWLADFPLQTAGSTCGLLIFNPDWIITGKLAHGVY